jgi:hypothetical protein
MKRSKVEVEVKEAGTRLTLKFSRAVLTNHKRGIV